MVSYSSCFGVFHSVFHVLTGIVDAFFFPSSFFRKENVGGGDFSLMFGADGSMQYMKSMDPLIHSNGPCLSNATYDSVTVDDSIHSRVEISGGRTNE